MSTEIKPSFNFLVKESFTTGREFVPLLPENVVEVLVSCARCCLRLSHPFDVSHELPLPRRRSAANSSVFDQGDHTSCERRRTTCHRWEGFDASSMKGMASSCIFWEGSRGLEDEEAQCEDSRAQLASASEHEYSCRPGQARSSGLDSA